MEIPTEGFHRSSEARIEQRRNVGFVFHQSTNYRILVWNTSLDLNFIRQKRKLGFSSFVRELQDLFVFFRDLKRKY